MKIFKEEFADLPGIGKEKWKSHHIKIMVTQEQVNELKNNFGIDVLMLVKNVLTNESYQNLGKIISNVVFIHEPEEVEWGMITYLLKEELKDKKDVFILTNVAIAAGLSYKEDFEAAPLDTNKSGSIYHLGKIYNTPVYVDPMLTFKDTRIAIADEGILEYKTNEKNLKLVLEGSGAPFVEAKLKYKLKHSYSKVFKINNLNL